jgi:hypothetical protein
MTISAVSQSCLLNGGDQAFWMPFSSQRLYTAAFTDVLIYIIDIFGWIVPCCDLLCSIGYVEVLAYGPLTAVAL